MSVQRPSKVTARADLTVFVSRHASGDLSDGVRNRLRRIDGVQNVDDVDIYGLRPGLNDITVEVRATLRIRPTAGDDAGSIATQLADGFGVKRALVTDDSLTSVG